jgi:hypothetical protein
VSDLLATGAPNKSLLDPLFGIYNVLTIAFGIGLFRYVRGVNQERTKAVGILGALFLVAEGIFGILDLVFPEDAGGMAAAAISSTGMLHIVFAGLCSATTMLTMLLMGIWFRRGTRHRGYGLYSFISVAIVFLSGGMTALTVGKQMSVGGLLERITMGAWLQWLFVIALMPYSSKMTSAAPDR